MKKIVNYMVKSLAKQTVYMEKSDCNYYTLSDYDTFHNEYIGTNVDTNEQIILKTDDLLGNYLI